MYKNKAMAISLRAVQVVFVFLACQPVMAVEIDAGDWQGSWDTTLNYGQGHRISDVDTDIVAISNAGTVGPTGAIAFPVAGGITGSAPSSNFDDGNTNFQDGKFSETVRFVTEVDFAH